MTAKLILKKAREKSLLRRHPWIFSGAIDRVEGRPSSGETLAVQAGDGRFLAWAAYSPASQIVARAWSFDADARVDEAFIRRRLAQAVEARSAQARSSLRLVNAESDGLPGLVVDRYADVAVIQCNSAGAARWRESFADALLDCAGVRAVYERSDAEVIALQGLAPRSGWLRGDGDTELQIE